MLSFDLFKDETFPMVEPVRAKSASGGLVGVNGETEISTHARIMAEEQLECKLKMSLSKLGYGSDLLS